uniref:NR LBD domain-containing protein n=1 Tax=Rhabditophanes sp. KR3021 TaxID=114890 RepID=A0AC35TYB0_9BILA
MVRIKTCAIVIIILDQNESGKKDSRFCLGKEMSREERNEFVRMINALRFHLIAFDSTSYFEKIKLTNYEKTLHMKDSMFLLLREKLEKNRQFENAGALWSHFKNDLETMVKLKAMYLSSFLFGRFDMLVVCQRDGYPTTTPEYQLMHHIICTNYKHPASKNLSSTFA